MRQLKQSRPSWVLWPFNLSSCSQTKLIPVREDKCCLQSSDKNDENLSFSEGFAEVLGDADGKSGLDLPRTRRLIKYTLKGVVLVGENGCETLYF